MAYTIRGTTLSANSGSFTDAAIGPVLMDDRLRGLTVLELSNTQLSASGLAQLLQDPRLSTLTELQLNSTPIGDAGLMAIAHSPVAPGLDALNVARIGATPTGIAAFADAMRFDDMSLLIGHQNVGDEGASALAQRPGLRRLDLTSGQVGPAGAVALLTQTTAATLSLRDNPIHLTALHTIAPSLKSISLKMTALTEADLIAFATAPAPGLRELNLEQVPITDAALNAIRQAPWLAQLDALSIGAAETSPQARRAFLEVWGTTRWISIYRRDLP